MIQFEVKKSVLKIGKHQGKTMYVARQVSHARLSADAVEERIERMTSLSRSDVRAAILALSMIIEEEIRTGRAVDLRELGTFKIVSTGRYQTEAKQVSAQVHASSCPCCRAGNPPCRPSGQEEVRWRSFSSREAWLRGLFPG